jgi:hypothetical protein
MLPFGQEQIIRSAEANVRLVSSTSGRLEIERTPLNDRSIATNHSADSPASPLRE